MSTFQGERFEVDGNYSADYVEWLEQNYCSADYVKGLEQRVESLIKANASLKSQLEAQRRAIVRQYHDQVDYIPYHEED